MLPLSSVRRSRVPYADQQRIDAICVDLWSHVFADIDSDPWADTDLAAQCATAATKAIRAVLQEAYAVDVPAHFAD